MKAAVAALTVLLLASCCSYIQAQYGPNTPTLCCFSYASKKIPQVHLLSYKVPSSMCSQPAVIFTTKRGREICADPKAQWVQDYMKDLKQN
ncbi:C-C motif chemokine 4 [Alligator mississippiensis]|uniref:C-C motif chemokine n=2 Tax=Alligator TaxID=8495 RepID=A0A151N6V2_ALLMI|nr:C-C motif chemokine 4-like [Alligator sinensis]XP_006264199.1 C-C motif chemokine 4 [Alligator mississippiensis]KYO32528.1 C-C motif chemokine 4-like [Alligator mississippiensis]